MESRKNYDPYLLEMKMECVIPAVVRPIIGFPLPEPCWMEQIPDFPGPMISGLELMSGLEDDSGFVFRLY